MISESTDARLVGLALALKIQEHLVDSDAAAAVCEETGCRCRVSNKKLQDLRPGASADLPCLQKWVA